MYLSNSYRWGIPIYKSYCKRKHTHMHMPGIEESTLSPSLGEGHIDRVVVVRVLGLEWGSYP